MFFTCCLPSGDGVSLELPPGPPSGISRPLALSMSLLSPRPPSSLLLMLEAGRNVSTYITHCGAAGRPLAVKAVCHTLANGGIETRFV